MGCAARAPNDEFESFGDLFPEECAAVQPGKPRWIFGNDDRNCRTTAMAHMDDPMDQRLPVRWLIARSLLIRSMQGTCIFPLVLLLQDINKPPCLTAMRQSMATGRPVQLARLDFHQINNLNRKEREKTGLPHRQMQDSRNEYLGAEQQLADFRGDGPLCDLDGDVFSPLIALERLVAKRKRVFKRSVAFTTPPEQPEEENSSEAMHPNGRFPDTHKEND
ncbi:hypothetical protein BSKO_02680 [Bryopsis sp. KO-2023]|nr:hypothetical protein BSKO_02680 [Bryopsis sp. KO-2023]